MLSSMSSAMESGIENKITDALSRVPISTGDNLLGFQIDIDYGLLEYRDIFEDADVKETGEPRCALLATTNVKDETLTADYVAKMLEELWLKSLRYQHWEAHSIEKLKDQLVLRFVTTSGDTRNDLCVTGKIVVSGLQG